MAASHITSHHGDNIINKFKLIKFNRELTKYLSFC